jgi:hypothetical protein
MSDAGNSKSSELEGLLVENEEGNVDKLLFEALEGRIAMERSSGRIVPRPGLFKLSQPERLIVLLLARHAAMKLGLPEATLEVAAEQLATDSQIPVKSCREQLSRLKASGLVNKASSGYVLPSWNLLVAMDELPAKQKESR